MPFAYYGAKHGLVKRGIYPEPSYRTIVEPFAGSAGYAVAHAANVDRVILIDGDPSVVKLWHRIQAITVAELDAIGDHIATGDRTNDTLVATLAGGTTFAAVAGGRSRQITPRMRKDWPSVRRRIENALPYIQSWEVLHARYGEAPDIEATWFIDPPYEPHTTMAGDVYRCSPRMINYRSLGKWCQERRGQVIVCEQSPARWLPFRPVAEQINGTANSSKNRRRTELVWTN